jgi:hypothetical protein
MNAGQRGWGGYIPSVTRSPDRTLSIELHNVNNTTQLVIRSKDTCARALRKFSSVEKTNYMKTRDDPLITPVIWFFFQHQCLTSGP